MENEKDIAIQIEGLKKRYRLGTIGGGTLVGDLQSWWARKRGKEDPNSKIGAKVYGKNETFMALDGIDLTIHKGERIGIIGHNGAGKSTLLKLLSRVTGPTEGVIKLDGRISSMLEVGTGFNGELTGRENIYLNGAILGMTKAEVDSKMEDIIEFSEVRQFIDTPVKRYSSGMYVKLAFSVAAHLDSEIMIMDEVLAVGDMAFQKKCLSKMRQVSEAEGRTVLYVSHNMNTIRQLCDRCIVLNKGKVVFEGDVESSINCYLGRDSSISQNVIVINDGLRDPNIKKPKVKITKIQVDNTESRFEYGSKMRLSLDIANETHSDKEIFIRIILRSMSGVSVTMTSTKAASTIRKLSRETKKYILDISNIVPGRYYLDFVVFELGDMGVTKKDDCLVNLYTFDILPSPELYHGSEWNTEWWGYVCNGYLQEDNSDG